MVRDFVERFESRLDKVTLTTTFPRFLEDMKSSDASFEMVQSNTLKDIRFVYKHNNVKKSIAVTFVNIFAIGSFKNQEFKAKGKIAFHLFKSVLKFKDVRGYQGLSKS